MKKMQQVLVCMVAVATLCVATPVNAFSFTSDFTVTIGGEEVSKRGFVKSERQRRRVERTRMCYPVGYKSKLKVDYRRNEEEGKREKRRYRSRVKKECRWVKNYLLPQ